MGDFDKNNGNQAPNAAAEKKKMMTVCVLGAVLAGVVGFHYLKAGPQEVSASGLSPLAASGVSMDETPEQARAELANDPTAKLLRGTTNSDAALETVPRDPFHISSEWQSLLVHPVEELKPGKPQTEYRPIAAPELVDTNSVKLTGVFREGQRLYAIINGDIVTAGATVGNSKVVSITNTTVVLQRIDSPNAPTATLTIDPKLK
jgi:hypothetical protein